MAFKVLIADDHPLIVRGICDALAGEDDMEVVGEAYTGPQAVALVGRTNPDFVLMDIQLTGMDGLTCLDRIRKRHPTVKVIMFSASTSPENIEAAFRRGAVAYIVKSVRPVDLASAIRQAHDQTVYHAFGVAVNRDAAADGLDLTERELTMLKAVARGMSNQAISKEFWVTEQTVKFHLTNIYRKLGVRNRTAAARRAHEQGLVDTAV